MKRITPLVLILSLLIGGLPTAMASFICKEPGGKLLIEIQGNDLRPVPFFCALQRSRSERRSASSSASFVRHLGSPVRASSSANSRGVIGVGCTFPCRHQVARTETSIFLP